MCFTLKEESCKQSETIDLTRFHGEMSERFKEHAWKACVGATLPGVRIPFSPPVKLCRARWGDSGAL